MNRIFKIFLTISCTLLALLCLLFATIGVVSVIYYDYANSANQYVKTTCTISNGIVAKYKNDGTCSHDYWIPLWKVNITNDSYSATTDPLNEPRTFWDAQNQLNAYNENVEMPCYCDCKMIYNNIYPGFDTRISCKVFTYCFVNITMTKQAMDQIYYYNMGIIFCIVSGVIGCGFILGGIIVTCCSRRRRSEYTYF